MIDPGEGYRLLAVGETAEDRYQRRLDAMLAGMAPIPHPPKIEGRGGYESRISHLWDVRDLYRPRAEVGCAEQYGEEFER